MKISDMMSKKTIELGLEAKSKEEAIKSLSDKLHENNRLSSAANFYDDVMKREGLESTNMGIGVAIPHGKSESVITPSLTIARLRQAIPWDEAEPVKVIILLAVPSALQGTAHLETIAKIASLLLEKSFVDDLMYLDSKEALLDSVSKHVEAVEG